MQVISRKNKINLNDYPYKRDIENRLLLAQLSAFEVRVLQEIVHSSLKIDVDDLADTLDVTVSTLTPSLEKLQTTKLFKLIHSTIVVDKDYRKYYESQLEKFDEDFQPDLEFLQGLLSKVPLHSLLAWYAIPRGADNIFASLVEKYLLTPSIYRQYLDELQFDDPVIKKIIKDVYDSPKFKVAANDLISRHQLSREKFEEYILLLEYHFVCCIKYEQVNDQWHEVVTPFYEWHEFLMFESETRLKPIVDSQSVESLDEGKAFAFIHEMGDLIKACESTSIAIEKLQKFSSINKYFDKTLLKLEQLNFISSQKTQLSATSTGISWLKKTDQEKVTFLASHSKNIPASLKSEVFCSLYTPRNIRLIEQALIKAHNDFKGQWVYLEDFVNGFMAPLGDKEPVSLKNKGKKWKYSLPQYSMEELAFIKSMITERFFELGILSVGQHNGKTCFKFTPYGRIALN